MADRLVTIAECSSAEEADAARSRLAAKHIAVVGEELSPETIPGGGRVKLQVRAADARRATRALALPRLRKQQPVSGLPGDQLAARALNAACLGLFILPVVLHVYSALLLLRLRWSGLELSAGGHNQVREARQLNRIILIGAAAAFGFGLLLWWGSN
jgi:hypothetical protein